MGPVLAAVLAITKRRYLQQQKQMRRMQACGLFLGR
jgi:hypothetical protein